jgi:hypothetical protein
VLFAEIELLDIATCGVDAERAPGYADRGASGAHYGAQVCRTRWMSRLHQAGRIRDLATGISHVRGEAR